MPSFTSSVNCGDFTVFYPDTAPCLFTACGGQYLSISSTYDSYGYAYLQLFDSSGALILSNDYSIELTTPVESACQTYTLQQGCYYYCTGRYTVYGGEPILSIVLLYFSASFLSAFVVVMVQVLRLRLLYRPRRRQGPVYHRVWRLAGNQLPLLHLLPHTAVVLTLPAIPTTLQSTCRHAISMHVQVLHFEQNMVMD
jgi:hypothetical protein